MLASNFPSGSRVDEVNAAGKREKKMLASIFPRWRLSEYNAKLV